MFEFDKESQRWLPAHHPFTSPHEEDMERLVSDPASVRARYYDLAMNGLELGSGSIRIHRQDVQQEIFRALGMSEEEARSRFGFFLEALTYGTPPHGGIALGLDRIAMILAGAQSLREVMRLSQDGEAIDLMVDATNSGESAAAQGSCTFAPRGEGGNCGSPQPPNDTEGERTTGLVSGPTALWSSFGSIFSPSGLG